VSSPHFYEQVSSYLQAESLRGMPSSQYNSDKRLMIHSVLIQAADTYLHIATEAVEALQIKTEDPSGHLYSRGLAPWCLTRPTFGDENNPNFWGCSLVSTTLLNGANWSSVTALSMGVSEDHDISDFVDKDGLSLAILMPKGVKPGIDWSATSFAVSTECFPLRNSSCELSATEEDDSLIDYSFNCSSTEPELKASGVLYPFYTQHRYYNWNRYVEEPPPFDVEQGFAIGFNDTVNSWKQIAKTLTDDEAEQVFSNPWQMLSAVRSSSGNIESDDDRFIFSESQTIFAYCNNTGSYRLQKDLLPMLICSSLGR
jgi:hypothetical protein